MKIFVVAPMQSEADNFTRAVSQRETPNTYVIRSCGIGKAAAAALVGAALQAERFDMVAVVGYAAAGPSFTQGQVICPGTVRYHDTVAPEGLVPAFERVYKTLGGDDAQCLTGDIFVDGETSAKLTARFGENVLFDMEGTAVAQVCYEKGIPVVMAKYISDIPGRHNYDSFNSFVASHPDFGPILDKVEAAAMLCQEKA